MSYKTWCKTQLDQRGIKMDTPNDWLKHYGCPDSRGCPDTKDFRKVSDWLAKYGYPDGGKNVAMTSAVCRDREFDLGRDRSILVKQKMSKKLGNKTARNHPDFVVCTDANPKGIKIAEVVVQNQKLINEKEEKEKDGLRSKNLTTAHKMVGKTTQISAGFRHGSFC